MCQKKHHCTASVYQVCFEFETLFLLSAIVYILKSYERPYQQVKLVQSNLNSPYCNPVLVFVETLEAVFMVLLHCIAS